MTRRTLLYVMNPNTPDREISVAAQAASQDDSHLTCLILSPAPSLPMSFYGVPPYGGMNVPDDWGSKLNAAHKVQKERVDAIGQLLAQSGVSGDVQSALSAVIDIKHHVSARARVSDEVFFATNLRDTPEFLTESAAGVLFHSPIGFRINDALSNPTKRIHIAWDSSEAASAAVHAALPHLLEADDVQIGCIDPTMTSTDDGESPGSDLAAWLSHHGCKVTVSSAPSGGRQVSTCIQDQARDFGADLVVMGAYGHARMMQTMLGGTTRSMIEQTDFPVLFAH